MFLWQIEHERTYSLMSLESPGQYKKCEIEVVVRQPLGGQRYPELENHG